METKGEIRISPYHKKEDYLNLKLNINSDETSWQVAIEILKDRIYGRYINQISLLLNDVNANGFTIMALNCLLIETLLQFRDGKDTTPSSNRNHYANFLMKEFPADFDTKDKAEQFYINIRCGILHSAQTKNESRLSDRNDFVVKVENSTLIVSVPCMSNALKAYFDNYLGKLSNPAEIVLRKNFIDKMKYVCRT